MQGQAELPASDLLLYKKEAQCVFALGLIV